MDTITMFGLSAALAAGMVAAPAMAQQTTYQISNANFGGGGMLSGTFTFNPQTNVYGGYSLTTTTGNTISGLSYSDSVQGSSISGNETYLTINQSNRELSIYFEEALSSSSNSTFSVFYEDLETGSRQGTGTVSAVQAAPEPGSWALMILGFGVTGAALRSRRRRVTFGRVAFAA